MRKLAAVAALIASASAGAVATAGEPERLAGLVPRLGHADFAEREAACRALAAAGDAALPALRAALSAEDAEVARRATDLVSRLTALAEARKLLAPTRVAVGEGTLGQLTDDWRKRTGVEFLLEPADLGDVSVPTRRDDPVPLWAALAAVARDLKLDVSARDGAAGATAVVLSPRGAEQAEPPAPFTGHAVAVAPLRPPAGVSLPPDTLSLIVQVHPEPKLRLQRLNAVVVLKALDAAGRDLETQPSLVKPPPAPPVYRSRGFRGGRIVANESEVAIVVDAPKTTFTPTATQALLRFVPPRRGPAPARLARVEGVLRATVSGPAEDLVRVTGLDLKPIAGVADRGLNVTVQAVQQAGDGHALFAVTVVTAPNDFTFGDSPPRDQGDKRRIAVYGNARGAVAEADAVAVTDAGGEPFESSLTTGTVRTLPDGRVSEQIVLRLQPTEKTSGAPTTVVVRGARHRPLDIPFTLKDVPLDAGPATPAAPAAPPDAPLP